MDPLAATNLLRYRFGDLQQMKNHLHVVERRTVFFWRDPRTALQGGQRVAIEFSFSSSEQVSIARGAVLGRVEGVESGDGPVMGVWLEFPDSRLAKRIDQGGVQSIAARKQKRLGCDLVVEVRSGRKPYIGRMIDISVGGCRITGSSTLRKGFEAELRLLSAPPGWPSDLGRVQVERGDGSEIGVRFVRTDAVSRIAAAKLFQLVQQAWAQAPEIAHPQLCCRGGHVLEPPLPHVRRGL